MRVRRECFKVCFPARRCPPFCACRHTQRRPLFQDGVILEPHFVKLRFRFPDRVFKNPHRRFGQVRDRFFDPLIVRIYGAILLIGVKVRCAIVLRALLFQGFAEIRQRLEKN